eukprot:TRINITY_DN57164_c0_g1_i1.p1 TRINITY_DN57164_c0_g1~~TRINITY_DN57164_c0_g1_i1.p1  ORF type:complete len:163 (+),score=42.59 TRINITY_DN57164_c0_g1_i1:91-579(+)
MGAKGSSHENLEEFTMEKLKAFDGAALPMYVGILGKVYDVSSSDNFQPGEGYGDLWAGSDATYALATLSLKKEDANRLDWEMSQFTEMNLKALAGWRNHFESKYPVVGYLKEYEGRDVELPAGLLASAPQLPGTKGGGDKPEFKPYVSPPSKVTEGPRTEHL